MMTHCDNVLLLCPVGEDDFGTIWRRYILCGVDLAVRESADGSSGTLYIFDDVVTASTARGKCELPEISPGCLISPLPDDIEIFESCDVPHGSMKIISVQYFRKNASRLNHRRILLK